jgi:hypothetical protein
MKADRRWWNDGRMQAECEAAELAEMYRRRVEWWIRVGRFDTRVPAAAWLALEKHVGELEPRGHDSQPLPPSKWWESDAPTWVAPVGMRCAARNTETGRIGMMQFDGERWIDVEPTPEEAPRLAEWQAALDAGERLPL